MKQKGGIRILPEYQTISKLISFIINNSFFEIFTENTSSGITILATLKPHIQEGSPCRVTRARGFNNPIIKFLFKFSLWGEKDGDNRDDRTDISFVTSTESVKREFDIQQDVFLKSSSDPTTLFEPLCPALITGICNIKRSIKIMIKSKILENLKSRTRGDNDSKKIRDLFENNISFIMMEFMEDYNLLSDLETDKNFRKYKLFSLYELTKLHSYGYKHGDYHNGNILINSKYPYFTNKDNELLKGRAIIIDFGLSEPIRINSRDRVRNINQYDLTGAISEIPSEISYYETEFKKLDEYRREIAREFISGIREMGFDTSNLKQYDLEGFNRRVLIGGLKTSFIKKISPLLKIKEKTMAMQPRKCEPWWSSHEEEKLALKELHDAIETQINDKDYHKKNHESAIKLVHELGSNEEFQKMITGIYAPPLFIGENSDTQDELLKELQEYDEKKRSHIGGNSNSKTTNVKITGNKRRRPIANKTRKRKYVY